MKKGYFLITLFLLWGCCACHAKPTESEKQVPQAQDAAIAVDSGDIEIHNDINDKIDNNMKVRDNKIDTESNDNIIDANDINKADNIKLEKQEKFILITQAINPFLLPDISPLLAADQFERALITNYEGSRTKQPWYIRINGKIEVLGEAAYDIEAGQGENAKFTPTIHGGISASRRILLDDHGTWMVYGDMMPDAQEEDE